MRDRLPIDGLLDDLMARLRAHHALVLRAPTGAGKTTRVPPALLDANLTSGQIVVLEPRRLAARAAARRMAQERGQNLGDEIGYHVRFDRQAGPRTRVIVMTPGILLRRLQDDPFLESVGLIVFDEFHERSLDSDLALGMAHLIQTTVRPELRLIVMSATLATERVAAYLGDCPVVTSEGRLHPVELTYEPRSLQQPWPIAAAQAIERLLPRTPGDILCFLPGMNEIRQTARALSDVASVENVLVLPLHGDLSAEDQDRALTIQDRRRVVLATNVAETSVTVEGVTGVVDTGLARMQMFDASVGMDRLELTPIARDAADQRAGRAGRTRPGVCVRLWTEASHSQRASQTLPEIRRVDLAGAALQLLTCGETDVRAFPWLEAPRDEAVQQALSLLQRLGATEQRKVSALGQAMARMPVHPRLARMLLAGQRMNQAPRIALAAALLSERDPFVRGTNPMPRKQHAGSASDVLDRVEALEAFEKHGVSSTLAGTLQDGAGRFLLRARDQLLRTLQQEAGQARVPISPCEDEGLLRALLAAFPDRVTRRRAGDPMRGLMVGGVGVRLAPGCDVLASELFLCIDVNADPREAFVRQASSIEREWLTTETRIEMFFDEVSERMAARKRVYYEDLLIEENDAALPRSEGASRQLAEAARTRLPRVLPAPDSAAGAFLVRLRCLRAWMPELNLPAYDDDDLRGMLPWACAGCRSFDEVRKADWLGLLQGKLSAAQARAVEREAPERVQVPSGNRLALQYEVGRPPILAVRIQEVFGLADTPRVAGGRVRVLLHLLAPNYRPQQVTDDLASFWKNTYQQVRKELRARYPKHKWPEDPWNG
ncbi:MAG: ATP-dependent helicase HrpB [Planctomycetes bacterium]|nr:ATP-dependent helicase HrpB [Planctomycetota bacterium]